MVYLSTTHSATSLSQCDRLQMWLRLRFRRVMQVLLIGVVALVITLVVREGRLLHRKSKKTTDVLDTIDLRKFYEISPSVCDKIENLEALMAERYYTMHHEDIGSSYPTQNRTLAKLDAVILARSINCDAAIVIHLLRQHASVDQIFVIGPLAESHVRKAMVGANTHLIDENEAVAGINVAIIGSMFAWLERHGVCRKSQDDPSVTWFFQQFIKLGFVATRDDLSEHVLVWDADMLPIRALDLFTTDGKMKIMEGGNGEFAKQAYRRPYSLLTRGLELQLAKDGTSFVTHQMLMFRPYLKRMLSAFSQAQLLPRDLYVRGDRPCGHSKCNLWIMESMAAACLGNLPARSRSKGFSEYAFYASFVLEYFGDSVTRTPRSFSRYAGRFIEEYVPPASYTEGHPDCYTDVSIENFTAHARKKIPSSTYIGFERHLHLLGDDRSTELSTYGAVVSHHRPKGLSSQPWSATIPVGEHGMTGNGELRLPQFLQDMESAFLEHACTIRRSDENWLIKNDDTFPLTEYASWGHDRATGGLGIWELYAPTWICPNQMRFGPLGDKGKNICNPSWLRNLGSECVIYSFGISSAATFEEELMDYAPNCRLRAFDPTVSWEMIGKLRLLEVLRRNTTTFRKVGLGSGPSISSAREFYSGANHTLDSLHNLMAYHGDKDISLLKVDIEGFEWDAFTSMQSLSGTMPRFPFAQLSIELHLPEPQQRKFLNHSRATVQRFMHDLEEHGFRAFAQEINSWPFTHNGTPCCAEFTFVRHDYPVF